MKKPSMWLFSPPLVGATCALLLVSCTGELHGPSGTAASSGGASATNGGASSSAAAASTGGSGLVTNPPAFQPAPGMLRRLTRAQFHNAIKDVFGVEVDVSALDPDSWNGNFASIGASTVVTSQTGVEQYQAAIEQAVGSVFADATKRANFVGCTPSGTSQDSCVRGFIESKGRVAWRRPLESAEIEQLAAVAANAATQLGSADEGARWATVAMFTSPYFLYRPELGTPAADGSLHFSDYEMASRLAFLIRNSLPDKALLDLAASGALATADGIRSAANALLDDPAGSGRQSVGAFGEEYMRLDRVLTQAKDAGLFPEYGPTLQAAMVRDVRATWEGVAFDEQASALSLFNTTKVTVNADLAKLYGLDATGLDSATFRELSLPADGARVGILSKAGFLSQFANQKEGSPTLRGKFIRDALMCKSIPPPPGNVNAMLQDPPADKPLTKRQRLEQHRTSPSCSACHGLMDPLGLPLETFDAVGRFRTMDHGLAIDSSGDIDGQAVADARAMGEAMSTSTDIANCLVRRYYSYAVGYEERDVDGSVVNALAASFQTSGFKLRQLVLDTVANQAFAAVAPQP